MVSIQQMLHIFEEAWRSVLKSLSMFLLDCAILLHCYCFNCYCY